MEQASQSATAVQKKDKEEVYDILRHRLVYLHYQPGQIINEKELCDEFGIGRTPLRELLLKLQNKKLLKILPRFGTFAEDINLLELKNLYQIREVLEGLSAALAVETITEEKIDALQAIIQEIKEHNPAKSSEQLALLDQQFHLIIRSCVLNQSLNEICEEVDDRCTRGWYYNMSNIGNVAASMDNLKDILTAIMEHDQEKARTAMETHVREFREVIMHIL
ncbi:MAG: GntR family transcriptional regulator [Firmicutes bacterium]|nr:GntR family transcriptional regulator [Bacillota bacterium]